MTFEYDSIGYMTYEFMAEKILMDLWQKNCRTLKMTSEAISFF